MEESPRSFWKEGPGYVPAPRASGCLSAVARGRHTGTCRSLAEGLAVEVSGQGSLGLTS